MKLSRRKLLAGTAALFAGAAGLKGFALERCWAEWTNHTVNHHPKGTQTAPLRIVQIADLHLRELRWYHKEFVKQCLKVKPDLIVFTGDQVDQAHRLPTLRTFLGLFPDGIQKVAIPGNWEYFAKLSSQRLKSLYKEFKTPYLVNESVRLTLRGKTLLVTGLDESLVGRPSLTKALQGHTPAKNHLVLSHCPDTIHVLARELKDPQNHPHRAHLKTVLSGHTHGGQISLFGKPLALPPGSGGFVRGWYDVEGLRMYISRGIGTSVVPIRFGNPAELALFEFYAA